MRLSEKIAVIRDFFGAAKKIRSASKNKLHPCRIAFLRLDGIGDFALWVPYAREYRRHYPRGKYHLTLIGNALWIDLAKELLDFDEYLALTPSSYVRESKYRQKINALLPAVDTVILPRFFREPLLEGMLTLTMQPQFFYAFIPPRQPPQKVLLKKFDDVISNCASTTWVKTGEQCHELYKNREMLQQITGAEFAGIWSLWETPVKRVYSENYIVLLPGNGKGVSAGWPLHKFVSVCKQIKNLPILVIGGKSEAKSAKTAAMKIGPHARAITNLSITEFALAIAGAAAVIGNDTGGIHLAALSGIPSVVPAGLGYPGCFLPYPPESVHFGCTPPTALIGHCPRANCHWNCTNISRNHHCACVNNLTIAQVLEKFSPIISQVSQ